MSLTSRVIVRLPNWLGDTVMAVPALRALREGWPDATVLVAGPWASVLAGQGLADTLVSYPRAWRGRVRTADTVRAFRADVAILLPNSLEAALSAWYWGARRRVGFAVGGRTLVLTDRVERPVERVHQIDEYLRLVEHLGVVARTCVPELEPPSPDAEPRRRARALLDEVADVARGPRVGVHLGAEYGSAKVWPAPRLVDGCRALHDAGLTPVLLGTPRERALAASIADATGAANLVGRDEPAMLPALLAELDAVVAGDTGVTHLAAALGTPVVALFGPTDPRLTAPRGPATILTHPVPCAPCFYRVCPIDHPCLDRIAPTEVANAVMTTIARAHQARGGPSHDDGPSNQDDGAGGRGPSHDDRGSNHGGRGGCVSHAPTSK